ncbi:MAG TPA: hypothetical protein VK988_11485 [Acidimicrobiales bacterium]|nr:hypothetical protein [Acidimicrobiales bacterium]
MPTQRTTEEELQRQARQLFDTTLGDVVNAVRAGNLKDPSAFRLVQEAESLLPEDHPELNDDDPDDRLGWHWNEAGEPEGD